MKKQHTYDVEQLTYDVEQLRTFVRYPTVSSDPLKAWALRACAQWLKYQFLAGGLHKAVVFSTAVHPVVYAEYKTHPAFPTILFYGHYDVQPADPLEQWSNPPFEPVRKGPYLYGRGASDDKGQLFIHLKAVEELIKSNNPPQANIKFLIEGAEELGSAGLKDFICQHHELLRCDVAVVSDTKMAALHTPAITYSLRGALNAEVWIQAGDKDVHSGTFGGTVPNAAQLLGTLVHRLYHPDGTIAIPGFYNDVRGESAEERAFMKKNGPSDPVIVADAAARWSYGESGYSLYEQTTIRPSLSVTGIMGGYQGPGVKNVIPATASVKLNFRLVPDQRPEKVQALLEQYLQRALPRFVRIKTVFSSPANPVIVSRQHPYITAATDAFKEVYRKSPKMIRAGGTIPAVDYLASLLKVPVLLMGFAQASDNMHAPDEKFYLPNLFRGIDTIKHFIRHVGFIHTKTPLYAHY